MDKLNELVKRAEKADAVASLMDAVNPHDILAIDEAFRALERENITLKQGCENNPLVHELMDMRERAEAAEAQLAELKKQKPVGTVSIAMDWNTHRYVATVNMRPDLVVSEMREGDELFTRAALAAVPVDDEALKNIAAVAHHGGLANLDASKAINLVRRLTLPYVDTSIGDDEILRRIEGLNK